jgi:NADH-quinone oxidoreductase subunit J
MLAAATIPDAITFAIAAVICVVGAFGVVLSRNPVHSALMLVMTLFGIAVLFVEENAQFLAAVQVIVYAGAIVVLFLFVIMLLGVDRKEAIERDPLRGQRLTAVCLGVLALVEVLLLARGKWPHGPQTVSGPLGSPAANIRLVGKSVFTTYLLAFEVTSALLVIAVVGAVVLARRPRRAAGEPGAPVDGLVDPDDVIVGPGAADDAGADAADSESDAEALTDAGAQSDQADSEHDETEPAHAQAAEAKVVRP